MEQEKIINKLGIRRPFYLYIGNAKEHKNVQTLIEAHKRLPIGSPGLVLVCAGIESKSLKTNDKIKIIPEVNDEDLPALYSATIAFVTASLYEGYCLPVQEAMACGCPVIATNRGAIPETAGEWADIVEPDIESISKAMIEPPKIPKSFITPKWDDTAEKTLEVLADSVK